MLLKNQDLFSIVLITNQYLKLYPEKSFPFVVSNLMNTGNLYSQNPNKDKKDNRCEGLSTLFFNGKSTSSTREASRQLNIPIISN